MTIDLEQFKGHTPTDERWVPLDVLPEYEISDHGRLRRGEFYRKLAADKFGYLRTPLKKDGKKVFWQMHRLVARHFIGPPPPNTVVAHLDGTRDNNHYANLAYVTVAENNRQRFVHLSIKTGSSHGMSKLTDAQVEEIIAVVKPGDRNFGLAAMSKKYGVCSGTIRKVLAGDSWRNSSRAKSLRDQIKDMTEALEPFAKAANDQDKARAASAFLADQRASQMRSLGFAEDDLIRARSALSSSPVEKEKT